MFGKQFALLLLMLASSLYASSAKASCVIDAYPGATYTCTSRDEAHAWVRNDFDSLCAAWDLSRPYGTLDAYPVDLPYSYRVTLDCRTTPEDQFPAGIFFTAKYPVSGQCPDNTTWSELTHSCSNRLRKNNGPSCDKGCDNPISTTTGNPINTATGNKFQSENDLSISSMLGFTRYYNSLSIEEPHLLTPRWTNTYTRRVTAHTGYVYVSRPDGKALLYTESVTNNVYSYGTDADTVGELERVPTSGTLTGWKFTEQDDRQVENFDSKGRLTSITTTSGESIALVYNNGVTENNANDFRLTSVTDQQGRALTFSYTGLRLNKITDPTGAEYLYAYAASNGPLNKVTYPGGAFKLYHYNEQAHTANTHQPQALTGITDENGDRFATYKYQADGRAISTEHGAGQDKYSVQYGSGSNPGATILTPSGSTETRGFATYFGVSKATSNLEQYGSNSRSRGVSYIAGNGKVDTVTDYAGVVTNHDYNSRNLETQRVDAERTPTSSNPAEKRTTVTAWHATFELPTERSVFAGTAAGPLKARTTWAYNARGQVTAVCQHAPGSSAYTCGSLADPNNAGVRQTRYTYCEQADVDVTCPRVGLLTKRDGPRPDTDKIDITTYVYRPSDSAGLYRKGDLWKVVNALNQETEIVKYDGADRVLQMKDIIGVVTDMEYSPRGWLTARKVRGSDGGVETDDAITRYYYDAAGQLTSTIDPDGAYIVFTYDDAHRLTDVADSQLNTIHYVLNTAGERVQEETRDSYGSLTRKLSRIYNVLGQLQTIANASSTPVADYVYDANGAVDTVTNAVPSKTDQDMDPLGRLVKVVANVDGTGPERATTQFGYDALDNLVWVADPNRLPNDPDPDHFVTRYEYSGLNDLTQLKSPDTGTTNYLYDTAGNRTKQTDARSTVTEYEYDELNRLTKVNYASATDSDFIYDTTQTGDCTAAGETFSKGRLTRFNDASGSTVFCYDRFGNVVKKVQRKGTGSGHSGMTWTTRFEYTLAGRVASITYQSGVIARYVHDTAGKPYQLWLTLPGQSEAEVVAGAKYKPFGPLTRLYFPDLSSGESLMSGSPGEGSLSILDEGGASQMSGGGGNPCPGGGYPPCPYDCPGGQFCPPTWTMDWSYDQDYNIASAVGNQFTVDASGRINSFSNDMGEGFGVGYDDLDRIENVVNSTTQQTVREFTYDATGNRQDKTTRLSNGSNTVITPYAYAANTHRLNSVGGSSRNFDANGNTTSINGRTHTYDDRNRLASVALGGGNGTIRFQYNARGERMRKGMNILGTNASDRGRYVYDESGKLLVEEQYDGSTLTINDIVWFGDRPVAVVRAGVIYLIATDHLGTPRTILDRQYEQTVHWRWRLSEDVFGESAPDNLGNGFVFNLRFPGQVFDIETGLHYNYFRDYESGTGRYVQSDPIGINGDISTYAYVRNNGLRLTDPTGLFSVTNDCPNECNKVQLDKFKNDVQEMCEGLDKYITDVRLANCLKKRCRSGKISLKCIGRARGEYYCDSDRTPIMPKDAGWILVFVRTSEGLVLNPEDTVIHEWAHSCNWTHGDGMGVPRDPGKDKWGRCFPSKPAGTELF